MIPERDLEVVVEVEEVKRDKDGRVAKGQPDERVVVGWSEAELFWKRRT